MNTAKEPPPRRSRRWGLWSLGFLILGFVAVFTAQAIGHHTVGTLGSLVTALVGATYCSARGIRDARERGITKLLSGRGPRD